MLYLINGISAVNQELGVSIENRNDEESKHIVDILDYSWLFGKCILIPGAKF